MQQLPDSVYLSCFKSSSRPSHSRLHPAHHHFLYKVVQLQLSAQLQHHHAGHYLGQRCHLNTALAARTHQHTRLLGVVLDLVDDIRLGCYLGRSNERFAVVLTDLSAQSNLLLPRCTPDLRLNRNRSHLQTDPLPVTIPPSSH